jgi:hypothetical protein
MRARLFAMLVASACRGSSTEAETLGFDSATMSTTGASSSSTGADAGSSSDTAALPEPGYPRPDPVAPDGMCPEGAFGPITFDGDAWVCLPECGEDEQCPEGASGTAEAACATNPYSSAAPCEDSMDCTEPGEMCGNVGDEQKGCLLPPTHCILRCDAELLCPDEMTCSAAGVCAYLP